MQIYKVAGMFLCSTLAVCCTVGMAMYYAIDATKGLKR